MLTRNAVTAGLLSLGMMMGSSPTMAASGPACFKNTEKQALYFSVRWPTGNNNFVLKPGETHRLNQMNDQDSYVCKDTREISGNSCPNKLKLQVNNC
jgi:hypothetical protein